MIMTQSRPHDHGLAYAEEDLGEVDPGPFTQRAEPDEAGVLVSGTCPRCHGRTKTLFRWGVPGTGGKGLLDRLRGGPSSGAAATAPDPLSDEVHFCECGHAHPQCPPDTSYRGCGASWRISR